MRFGRPALVGVALSAALAALVVPSAIADTGLAGYATTSLRSPIASDQFYFVMTDRYRDGNPANNTGGLTGPISVTGYEPTSDGFFHGGDLAGLTGRCDVNDPTDDGLARIKRLGFTAVWITPPFVQRTVQGSSAAYHGYWFLDITKPDPHLGTEAEFTAFMACAKRLGIKVFLDVVVNHTADVISFKEGPAYVSLGKRPYRTAAGRAFDPWSYTSGTRFPRLSPVRSFAKTPIVEPALAEAKVPAILNQVVRYHNRGDIDWSTCVGRCEMDGDFVGLDDLMTEDWAVVEALAEAYGGWITKYGIDGFRIDTAKHVDPYFFSRWLPLIDAKARAAGKTGFTSFGEAWYVDTAALSEIMIARGLPSVLDFPFQDLAKKYVTGEATGGSLAALFGDDDYYTSATTNAYGLTTFLGNHDMGRIGFFLTTDSPATGQQLLERGLLAHDLLYLTRGVPVVYYGDEVGMTGSGGGNDKKARQDMFPTQVPEWQVEERIGGQPIGKGSSFAENSPIEARLRDLARIRSAHPALASGAQITRYGDGPVFVASRIDAATRTEYLVGFNNSDSAATVSVPTSTPSTSWSAVLGGSAVTSGPTGTVSLTVPARGTVVLKAGRALPQPAAPSIRLATSEDFITGKHALEATVPGADPATVTFVMRAKGGRWAVVGVDDARPYRVFLTPVKGRTVEVAAIVKDTAGQVATSPPRRLSLNPFF